MDLREVILTISNSTPHDWNSISCWGMGSGPTYRDEFRFCETGESDAGYLFHRSHTHVAAFIPNPLITIAWGLDSPEPFEEPWALEFPNRSAVSGLVDVFYAGALVFRDVYVVVDGGRALLPLPAMNTMEVPMAKRCFFQLIDALERHITEFVSYFRQAGMKQTDDPWPVFSK
jgi:hypothetical protein